MKRGRTILVALAAAMLLSSTPVLSWSGASGVHSVIALFESHVHPDLPFDRFAAGRLGIIKPTWDHSYLYVAYRYLAGPGFDPGEQKAIVSLWNEWLGLGEPPAAPNRFLGAGRAVSNGTAITVGEASAEWLAARNKVFDQNVETTPAGPKPSSRTFTTAAGQSVTITDPALDRLLNLPPFGLARGMFPTGGGGVGVRLGTVGGGGRGSLPVGPYNGQVSDNHIDSIDAYRQAPAQYGSFDYANCNGSSFHTATSTLQTMVAKFGLSSPQVKQWVDAQDQVFNNCSGTPPHRVFNPAAWIETANEWIQARKQVSGLSTPPLFSSNCEGQKFRTAAIALETMIGNLGASNPQVKQWVDAQDKALAECSRQPRPSAFGSPTPTPAPDIPDPLKGGTPFEQAQRNYQIACANFYSANFDTAAKMFDAIASDPLSPWRQLAPYLVARAMIRKATLSAEKNDHAVLAQAEAQLNEIIASPGDAAVKRDAKRLLGFVQAQLHPEEREQELARAVMLSTSADTLKQDVSDYIWTLDHGPSNDNSYSDDLTDWISTLHVADSSGANSPAPYSDTAAIAHSIEKWKQTSSLPWLVAAISKIPASDLNAHALIKAADSVNPDSPAFATVTYHIARLMIGQGKTDDARDKLDVILARHDELPISTLNEFKALRMELARNLSELLVDAPRTPLGFTDDADSEELPSNLDNRNHQSLKALASEPLFDDDGAAVLTRWLPLSMQIEAAHSETLPSNLRAQVALAAFVRAILLGNEAGARFLAPQIMQSFPKLEASLDAWLAANNPDAQRFAAAFMMLQNPGLRFQVDPGPGRATDLDDIDGLRDNWWPSRVSQNLQNETYPRFLSAAEKKSADDEWQKLSAINAPNFLCTEAIEQAKSHPSDDRAPEALYRCLRAVHLGCSNDEGTELAKSAFKLLHRRYPDSPWAEQGKVWYKGDSCTNS